MGSFWDSSGATGFSRQAPLGSAISQLAASNSTSTFSDWISQTQTSLFLSVGATASQVILFVALLLIPRIPTQPVRFHWVPRLFTIAMIFSWFVVVISAMAAAVPQTSFSIRATCGPNSAEVNFALGQIFTFLEFSRAYLDVAGVMSIFTAIWFTAVINTGPLYKRRRLIRIPAAIVLPLIVFSPEIALLPLTNIEVDRCVSLSGTVTVQTLPPWWEYATVPILIFFMILGLLVLWKPKKTLSQQTLTS